MSIKADSDDGFAGRAIIDIQSLKPKVVGGNPVTIHIFEFLEFICEI